MPLLLLPGTVCDERLFVPVLGSLPHPDVRVAQITGARSTPELAAHILATAPDRFALAGFSLGGIVALEMIAQAPERIERLALIDTTPRPDPVANAETRRAAAAKARAEGMDGYILDMWETLVSPANVANGQLRQVIVDMARDAGPDILAEQAEVAIHRTDSRPRLGQITVPTLILAGADEQICPLDAHEELTSGIADARYFTISDAGHFSPLENPTAVARHMRDWLS